MNRRTPLQHTTFGRRNSVTATAKNIIKATTPEPTLRDVVNLLGSFAQRLTALEERPAAVVADKPPRARVADVSEMLAAHRNFLPNGTNGELTIPGGLRYSVKILSQDRHGKLQEQTVEKGRGGPDRVRAAISAIQKGGASVTGIERA